MKKEGKKESSNENNFGLASVVLGIVSLFSFGGLILGIIALVFAKKQEKVHANKWSKAGKILGIIGIILGILLIIFNIWYAKNPGLFSQFSQTNVPY